MATINKIIVFPFFYKTKIMIYFKELLAIIK